MSTEPKLYSIPWHAQCLESSKRSNQELADKIKRLEVEWNHNNKMILFHERQIEAAKLQKKETFDPERFLRKQRPW